MSLTAKAIDRLIARVVDRLAAGVPNTAFPVHPEDLNAALDRAARQVTQERFKASLDDGSFDHRVNDTLDHEVAERLDRRELMGEAKDKLDQIIEDKLDEAGFGRQIERAVENLDLEDLAASKFEHVDFDAIAKEVCIDELQQNVDMGEVVAGYLDAHETIPLALAKRYDCTTVQAVERAAQEVITTAVGRLEDAVAFKLEGEVVS